MLLARPKVTTFGAGFNLRLSSHGNRTETEKLMKKQTEQLEKVTAAKKKSYQLRKALSSRCGSSLVGDVAATGVGVGFSPSQVPGGAAYLAPLANWRTGALSPLGKAYGRLQPRSGPVLRPPGHP